jgi:2'-5' RNA ligase
MPVDEIIAFWLMPAAPASRFFAKLVGDLAARTDAPVFEPHVTLSAGKIKPAAALQVLPQTQQQYGPLDLEIDRIDSSEEFTKTLFVQFRPSPAASALSRAIANAVGAGNDYEFNPHLSLLYKEMPPGEKAALADAIVIPFSSVVFDRVKVLAMTAPITKREQVEAWRPLGAGYFTGAAT